MLYLALVLYVILALGIVTSLLVNGVRPARTLAWLLAIFTIPVGGILLYVLIGRNRRKNKLIRLKRQLSFNDSLFDGYELPKELYPHRKVINLVKKNSYFAPTFNNSLMCLKDGKITFDTIFVALENATSYIHLQYYIFEEGELADRLLKLFRSKIKKGVKVRLIYDGIGSFSLSRAYLRELKEIGVEAYSFLPFRFGRFLSSLNYRNHRKIIVVDGVIAFTGGINVSDKYLKGDSVLGDWYDIHLKIEGVAAGCLDQVFLADWKLVSGQQIKSSKKNILGITKKRGSIVQIVSSGPDDDFPAIEQVYFSIINTANEYLYITNPYIIPGYAILTALETAALSGVDVRLLVSAENDSRLVNWSVRSYFEPLLKAGVKIYLFSAGFLHSKVMVSDDTIASIGTANIDVRSFEQNYEVNVIVYDDDFAKELKRDFLNDIRNSELLNNDKHQKRPWSDKLKEGAARVLGPLL